MGTPVDWHATNMRLVAPEGRDDVLELRAFTNGHECVTAWELSREELIEVVNSGLVFLGIQAGGGMPPALVGSETAVRHLCIDGGAWKRRDPPNLKARERESDRLIATSIVTKITMEYAQQIGSGRGLAETTLLVNQMINHVAQHLAQAREIGAINERHAQKPVITITPSAEQPG